MVKFFLNHNIDSFDLSFLHQYGLLNNQISTIHHDFVIVACLVLCYTLVILLVAALLCKGNRYLPSLLQFHLSQIIFVTLVFVIVQTNFFLSAVSICLMSLSPLILIFSMFLVSFMVSSLQLHVTVSFLLGIFNVAAQMVTYFYVGRRLVCC